MWIQRKLFKKIVKKQNFDSFQGPKWPKNLGLWGPYSTHPKGTCSEYVKQCWSKNSENFLRKWRPEFLLPLGPKMAHKLGLWGPYCNVHISDGTFHRAYKSKTDKNPEKIFWQNSQKPEFWFIWRPKLAQKFGPLGPTFNTPTKVAPMSL